MTQYQLDWFGRVMFPKKGVYYVGVRNKEGEIEAKRIEFPNAIPWGFKPDRWYDVKKDNVPLP